MLTDGEQERYERQLLLREIGEEGQKKLKGASVFVAGAGGLGCSAVLYLAAAGVGRMRLVDHDRVEPGNLNRQVLHWDEDIGRTKAASATAKLKRFNNRMDIEPVENILTTDNVSQLVAGFDVIVDALDNLPARYVLNRAALEQNIPLFHGAVYGFEGRATTIIPGETACLRCVCRDTIPGETFPVIGVTPAVIGCIQATEVIKYIAGCGRLLTNRLLIYDGLNMSFAEYRIKKDPHCDHCGDAKANG